MKLIQIQSDSRVEIKVLRFVESSDGLNLVLSDAYSRGLGIRHVLVDDDGAEDELELLTDSSTQPPFVAFAAVKRSA